MLILILMCFQNLFIKNCITAYWDVNIAALVALKALLYKLILIFFFKLCF